MTYRSGFACLVGRPNAGKSSLTNAMAGAKVAITSNRPQTTRHAIRAVINRPDQGQLIMIDTPGLHKPRTLLGERLNDLVRTTWAEVDTVGLCLPADQKPGPGDRYIAEQLKALRRTPVLLLVTKLDLVDAATGAAALAAAHQAALAVDLPVAEIVPVSAHSGMNVDVVTDLFLAQLPEGPQLYPDDTVTDEPEEVLVAELIREAALEGVRDELPHSLAVTVEEMTPREGRKADDPLLDVFATIHVERDSQKPIIIGRKGARLSEIGTRSRMAIQGLLGTPVYLNLHVRVAKDWQRDPKQLRRLGF
ncbi:MAG: GTPase [Actinomycetota bacterium]|nr:GTPase [Actinomycetota bacterium]